MKQGRTYTYSRLLMYLLTLLMIVIMVPALTFADNTVSGTCGDNLTWTIVNGTLTISGTGEMAQYEWYSDVPWFSNRGDISTIVIAKGVTSVCDNAFYNCYSLTSVTIPNSVTIIGDYAFQSCYSLTSITIPSSVTSMGWGVFSECDGLTTAGPVGGGYNIEFGWTKSIPECAFSWSELTSITIPGSVTSMGYSVFSGCDDLTTAGPIDGGYNIEFGWTKTIPQYAFWGSELTSIIVPKSITNIGADAFSYCDSLTIMKVASGNSVYHSSGNCIIETASKTLVAGCKASVIPTDGSVTSIGEDAFWSCTGLTSIKIPSTVTSIGDYAFSGCSSLTSITIPSSVTSMGWGVFSYCDGLTTAGSIGGGYNIEFGWTKSIPDYAFSSCASLQYVRIPASVTSMGWGVFSGCDGLATAGLIGGGYNIEFGWTKSIPEDAFAGSELTSITIPKNVTSIGNYIFRDCYSLTSIKVASGNSVYHSSGNCIIETASKTLVAGCRSSVIPTDGSVTNIGEYAFYGCGALTSISIPENVTRIENWAFAFCGLNSITLPKRVTSIGVAVFSSCDSLTSVKVASGNSVYHSSGNCIIKTGSKTLVAGCKSSVIPTDGSVTKIGERAFYDCDLTSITIPKSVTSIGDYAFGRCYNLISITIPGNVTRIGEAAFWYCTGLAKVTIPNSVTNIADGAFQCCSSLTSITIPGKVTTIGNGTFALCDSLTSVTIPASVTTIERGAFASCDKLKNVYYGGSKSDWGKISIATENNEKLINAKFTYNVSILSITANPKDATASVGDTAKFKVTATGDDLIYQWQYRTSKSGSWKNSTASSATTKTVSVKATAAKNGYQYRCKITDGNGKVIYSNVATLYVSSITKQPSDATVSVGSTAKFTVTATGQDLTYQWQYRTSKTGGWKNSGATGSTTKTLSVKGTADRNGYQYRCKITDANGTAIYTNAATLTVSNAAITKQPSSATVSAGSTAKFTVTTTGDNLTYQWQYRTGKTGSWKNSGATGYKTNTLSVKGTADRNGYQYRCKITDANGTVIYTNAATLTVSNAKITKQPSNTTVSVGSTAKFTVTTTGDNLTYQWQYRTSKTGSWKNSGATGATTKTLSVKGTADRNGYQYRCKITDANGTVIYTNAATLTVSNATITKQPSSKTVSAGSTAKFSVTTTGNNLTYQWQYRTSKSGSWKNSSATGHKTNTLSVKGTAERNGYQYRCKITDANGVVIYTNAVTLTVK